MSQSVIVALADGFEEIEAVTPIDILRRAGLNLMTVGITGRLVKGAHGIVFTADKTWDDVANLTPNVLVFPGGMPGSENLGKHVGLKEKTLQVAADGGWLAAICAAPAFTLGAWGLLSNRKATCFPGCDTAFPADVRFQNESVVVDGRIITGRGPGAASEFAFKLVELLVDAATAKSLKAQMQYTS